MHYAEPNLALLTEVSTANVEKAVVELAREGYFDQIKAEAALSQALPTRYSE